jgi:hypothetical protein
LALRERFLGLPEFPNELETQHGDDRQGNDQYEEYTDRGHGPAHALLKSSVAQE